MKVAVYGTLKAGYHNHSVLGPCTYEGNLFLSGYKMVSLGGFPGIVVGEGEIVAEVYTIDPSNLEDVDALEGHPDWYTRTPVETEYGEVHIYVLPADEYGHYPTIATGLWQGD